MNEKILQLKEKIARADAVMIGAGAGLSTSAGFTYSGERFDRYFGDFSRKYGFTDMYTGGFYPYKTQEELWAFWSRNIYVNRYMDAPKPYYRQLFELVKEKDYFVLTTNVDHCFQKAGFDKKRLFYTQGDYGLFQCSKPCHKQTYYNEEIVRKMVLSQGYEIAADGTLTAPANGKIYMSVPSDLLPRCPVCGRPMALNLRSDDRFVEDAGWYAAAAAYESWVAAHQDKAVVYLEIGVGFNTPGIIKYNFWQQTHRNPKAVYACLNLKDAAAPEEIRDRSICVNGDFGEILADL